MYWITCEIKLHDIFQVRLPRTNTYLSEGRNSWECQDCQVRTTATAGAILDTTKLPLTRWVMAMYLLTEAKNNITVLELMRHLVAK